METYTKQSFVNRPLDGRAYNTVMKNKPVAGFNVVLIGLAWGKKVSAFFYIKEKLNPWMERADFVATASQIHHQRELNWINHEVILRTEHSCSPRAIAVEPLDYI